MTGPFNGGDVTVKIRLDARIRLDLPKFKLI